MYPNYANQEWSVNESAIKTDRQVREKVLSELTEDERTKLIARIEADPLLGERLGLTIVEENDVDKL